MRRYERKMLKYAMKTTVDKLTILGNSLSILILLPQYHAASLIGARPSDAGYVRRGVRDANLPAGRFRVMAEAAAAVIDGILELVPE